MRQGKHAALGIVKRAALQRDKLRGAGEGGSAISGGDSAGERPMASEGGEGASLLPLREKG